MATTFAVISALGKDRVGIVDDLSGVVAKLGGNIEESKMAVLGGEFAVMMLVTADASVMGSLERELPALEKSLGLHVSFHHTDRPAVVEQGRPYVLETVSLDHFGIVHAVSGILRGLGINIESLDTETTAAPHTGAILFRLRADIVLGKDHSVAALKRELESLQETRDIDVSLRPVSGG